MYGRFWSSDFIRRRKKEFEEGILPDSFTDGFNRRCWDEGFKTAVIEYRLRGDEWLEEKIRELERKNSEL